MSSHAHAAGGMGGSVGKGGSGSVRPGLVFTRQGVGWTGVLVVGGGGERSRGELSSSEEGTGTAAGGGGCRGIGACEGGPKPQSEEAWRSTHRSEHLTRWPTAVPPWAGAGRYPAPSSGRGWQSPSGRLLLRGSREQRRRPGLLL